MEQNDQANPSTGGRTPMGYQEEMDDEINLIDLVYPIYKKRKFLILFCVGVAIAVGFVSFLLPKTYEATAIILPTSEDSSGTSLSGLASSLLGQTGLGGLISLGGSSPTSSDVLEAELNSNELTAWVLKRYDYFTLMGVNKKAQDSCIKSAIKSLEISSSKTEPTISIKITSKNPVLAADLANSYVKELDKYNQTNSFTSSHHLREYLEKRLSEATSELDSAQLELNNFQEKNKTVSVTEQAQATIKVLGDMEAQKVVLEVERSAKAKFYNNSYIEVAQLDAQIEALRKNIDSLTYSENNSVPIEREKGRVDFFIPLTKMTGLSFDESKLLLHLKAKAGVITLLTSQLEQAKLNETKDMPTINVLEWATPPNNPAKPNVILNVALGIILSIFLGIFVIFFMEFIHRMDQDPETAPKWLEMKKGIAEMLKIKKKF
jgi:uncharacterized protein involved in exopolysaccharide biosynthesis